MSERQCQSYPRRVRAEGPIGVTESTPDLPPELSQTGALSGPDVPMAYLDLSYTQLVDDFIAALPSPDLADRILVDNPARLYEL